ncbi:GAF domain-containing sensor histidine kinase [Variovorax ginsengisoli]|uniref:histidine kinase n=1 Tax=Variovorax guangxiensis TaxID=1775474 RepID=A0A502DXC9_9BURK|nr:response regulator [Variovorax guangxiensis]TPG26262.1 GAF domain-containing sensor histidine kinase [Variovorax ginsengisoli]TPG29987.1 GAF domain-containing sensor histidine kinase [Variovorax guangxiensis]
MNSSAFPPPPDEARRLQALRRLKVLDTLPESLFDDIVLLASEICGTPIALISLIDTDRQWFKARRGLDATQTHRDHAFCAHAIIRPSQVMTVPDALQDSRFASNPLVLGDPNIRFYAGAPVLTPEGDALGTVCVIDTVPRDLDPAQEAALQALARQTSALLQAREATLRRQEENETLQRKITAALADDDEAHASFRQSQRLAMVGQLTGGIAHDFNNLLQTISGSFQLIDRKADDTERVRRWAAGGLRAAAHGARLTSQLLDFSRNHLPDARPISVPRLVGAMQDMLARALGPEIDLRFLLADEHTATMGDATQLEAAVLNMAINARDAMQGRGTISVATRLQQATGDAELVDGAYLTLCVLDDGPGMPAQVAQRAFEPFFTTKPSEKGTGLGLAQVAGYAARAGGTARIDSTPGCGTAITLWLRVVEDTAAAADASAQSASQRLAATASPSQILLVDDDAEMREMLAELLSEGGYQVRRAHSGAAALQAAQAHMPDLVLIDCAMSGMNGAALAARLRELKADLPMIFVTGHADVGELLPGLGHDAVVLQKPVLLTDLALQIERVLARSLRG